VGINPSREAESLSLPNVAVEDIRVAADKAYQNDKKDSHRQDARIEHDGAPRRVMMELLADHTELFKQFSDNPGFKKWLSDTIFQSTYTNPPNATP